MVSLGDSPILKACCLHVARTGPAVDPHVSLGPVCHSVASSCRAQHQLLWGCSYCVSDTVCPLQGGEHTR